MSNSASKGSPKKKLLEKSAMAPIMMPVAIVLLGSLLVFGIVKMLSTERSHRDLIREMESKTFGNRWVAAFELSKLLARKSIPEKENQWVIERLSKLYDRSNDARTKNFLILALSTFKTQDILPVLYKGLKDSDSQVQFNAVIGIGNMKVGTVYDWVPLMELMKAEDQGLKQVLMYTFSKHSVPGADLLMEADLKSSIPLTRYVAAISLISYGNKKLGPVLKEILDLAMVDKAAPGQLRSDKVMALKLNVINGVRKSNSNHYSALLQDALPKERNPKIEVKLKETIRLLLKNNS
ncbi:MAG: hypothetical protein HOE90_08270 [Bacteriovoracaceae bacterium]|mgnify:CR=1 FL=1|nr:hypothetical protein [Bacteriovoracaceae bacterium]